MKRFLLIVLLLLISACSQITHPVPYGIFKGMRDGAPEGTPDFRAGWKDGCTSGMAAYGPLHYKATNSFKYDPNQLQSSEYHNAWRLGFRHCRWYTSEWNR